MNGAVGYSRRQPGRRVHGHRAAHRRKQTRTARPFINARRDRARSL